MNIGHVIKTSREKKGIKQKDLALLSNISPAYLSQIEKNIKDPNLNILNSISNSLNIPLPVLFFMSLNVNDIEGNKREAFKLIQPSINAMLNEFFI